MLTTIRPFQIFSLLGADNRVEMTIPTVPGTESLTIFALDTQLLIAVARLVKAQRILELGTALGYTALHLAANTSAEIVTVDHDPKPAVFEPLWRDRIRRIDADIFSFRPDPPFDLVFCDINATEETIQAETEIAFACAPQVVAWHDYGNRDSPAMTPFLDHLSESFDLTYVADSRMVFWFRDGLGGLGK